MKTLTTRRICLLIGSLFALAGAPSAFANAGDTISNIATINYSVGGVAQTAIESSPTGNTTAGVGSGTATTFVEDRVVNFTVAEAGTIGYATANPGQNDVALQFTVTNNSNQTLDFLLRAVDTDLDTHNGGAADSFDATGVQVFVESGVTAGYQAAQDTGIYVDELAEGGSQTVYIIGDIPAGATDSQTAGYALVAQVAQGSAAATQGAAITNDDNNNISPAGTYSNGATVVAAGTANNVADNTATVQTVFNDPAGGNVEDRNSTGAAQDAARNGQASDSDAYEVNAAILTVTKTSSVISDPVNGTTNPKSIPGAIVQYTVTIVNGAGGSTAQSVAIADSLATEIGNGTLAYSASTFNAQGTCPGSGAPNPCGILVTAPDINGGVAQAITNTNGDGDGGNFNANVVNMSVGNLDAGETATVQFRVQVQ
jgi:hypothetical protein